MQDALPCFKVSVRRFTFCSEFTLRLNDWVDRRRSDIGASWGNLVTGEDLPSEQGPVERAQQTLLFGSTRITVTTLLFYFFFQEAHFPFPAARHQPKKKKENVLTGGTHFYFELLDVRLNATAGHVSRLSGWLSYGGTKWSPAGWVGDRHLGVKVRGGCLQTRRKGVCLA